MHDVASWALLTGAAVAWPSDLLKHGCAKGELLVAGGFAPPPIMGALPELDASMLVVVRTLWEEDGDESTDGTELQDGETISVGESLELRYVSTRHPPLSTHLVFISSSGFISGGEQCGTAGAHLHCSTCGETPGWLNRAVWTATAPGAAVLAVGAARGGFGTPAVRVALRTVNVTAQSSIDDGRSSLARVEQAPAQSWLGALMGGWRTRATATTSAPSCGADDGG